MQNPLIERVLHFMCPELEYYCSGYQYFGYQINVAIAPGRLFAGHPAIYSVSFGFSLSQMDLFQILT